MSHPLFRDFNAPSSTRKPLPRLAQRDDADEYLDPEGAAPRGVPARAAHRRSVRSRDDREAVSLPFEAPPGWARVER